MIKQLLKTFFPFGLFMQMSILSKILGGSKSSSKSFPDKVFQPQANFFNAMYPQLTSLFKQGMADPGSVIPGFDPNEIAGQEANLAVAGGMSPTISNATDAMNMLFNSANPNNPLVTGAIEAATNPLFKQFQNVVAPGIRRAAGSAGRYGDPKAARLAAGDLMDTTGNMAANISLGAHQQGLNAIQGGMGNLGNLFKAMFTPGDVMSSVGQERRQMDFNQSPFGLIDLFRQAAGQPIVLGQGSKSSSSSSPGLTSMFKFTGSL